MDVDRFLKLLLLVTFVLAVVALLTGSLLSFKYARYVPFLAVPVLLGLWFHDALCRSKDRGGANSLREGGKK